MRVRAFFVLLALAFALGLVACSPAAAESPAPPPGPTPLAATPAQAVARPAAATPAPASAEPSPAPPTEAAGPPVQRGPVGTPVEAFMPETEAILSPEQADAEGLSPNPSAFYLRQARLDGTTLVVEGDKPTPCHRVVADVQVRDDQVRVKLYTRAAAEECIAVLKPVTATLDLTPYLDAAGAGTYTVMVNGQTVGQVTVP